MGCSRLGQSCSLLASGVHQRRGTDPAGLGGSTGGSGGSPPEEKQTTMLRLHRDQNLHLTCGLLGTVKQ